MGNLEFSSNAHYRYLNHSYSLYVLSRLKVEKDRLRHLIHRWSRECKLERKEEDLSDLSWSWREVELDRKKVSLVEVEGEDRLENRRRTKWEKWLREERGKVDEGKRELREVRGRVSNVTK